MQTVTIDEAKTQLTELIDAAAAGEEVVITKNGVAVQLVSLPAKIRKRQFGSAQGQISMSADFDAPLDDFQEYQQ